MKLLLPVLLSLSLPLAAAVDSEFSGNLEAQGRYSWNNELAKRDLFQDWDSGDFYMVYGNLNEKIKFDGSRIEANWFLRGTASELYTPPDAPFALGSRDPYFASQIFTFPNELVARDLFNLQYKKRDGVFQLESVLNKLLLEYDIGDHRLTVGRMYINYGLGEIFNPVNPFNQPTGLTAISQVAQGNDGISFNNYYTEKLTVQLFLLGDRKKSDAEEDKIQKTVWVRAEVQPNSDLQLDLVAGEDQDRYKAGGQLSYRLSEAMVFTQFLYQTKYISDVPSNTLIDAMLGFDQQLTAKWHLRFEGGYQEKNQFVTLDSFGERFLPTEYFVAIANQYDVHPLVKLSGTVINDLKSGFTYVIAKGTLDLGNDTEFDAFAFVPAARGDAADNDAQKLVTTDIGAALRVFF